MLTIAQCKLAFDMMCERALSRESHHRPPKFAADPELRELAEGYRKYLSNRR